MLGAPGKYLVAGLTAFSIEYVSFYLMYKSGLILIIANSVSFILGLLTSFTINRVWTFGHDQYERKASHQLFFYATLALLNLVVSNIVIEVFRHGGLEPEIGKLVIMLAIPIWNFFIFKKIIFRHAKNPN